jgi:hypothetical protein
MTEYHMTRAFMIPKDPVTIGQTFQILDPPVPGIPPHLRQGFVRLNHIL